MPYCVNCGTKFKGTTLCRTCGFDPHLAKGYVDDVLQKVKSEPARKDFHLDFAYPSERLHLVLSVIIASVIGVFVTGITLGLFLLLLLVALIYFRAHQVHYKEALIPASSENFGHIYELGKISAYRLRIPLPPIYIKQDPNPNAFTMGFWGDSWIVLHSSLIELLSPAELLSIIGHEMGHIKNHHTTWLVLTNPVRENGIPLISFILRVIFNTWLLRAEYTGDRAGLIAVKDFRPAAMAEIKLALGKKLSEEFNLEVYLEKILKKKEELLPKITEMVFRTHPYIGNRIRQLKNYSESKEYKEIINKT